MSTSKEDIFNRALGLIGGPNQTSYIDNAETDDSTQAVWLRIVYPSALDYCAIDILEDTFTQYTDLDQTTDSPEILDWAYAFEKPPGMVHLVKLTDEGDRTQSFKRKIVGKYILCDELEPFAEYIFSPEGSDMSTWPPGFSSMVAARMGVEVGAIWKPKIIGFANARYEAARNEALEQRSVYEEPTEQWADIA